MRLQEVPSSLIIKDQLSFPTVFGGFGFGFGFVFVFVFVGAKWLKNMCKSIDTTVRST